MTSADLRQWRRRADEAARAVGADQRSLVQRVGHVLDQAVDRVSRRVFGSGWPVAYRAGPLTAAQADLLLEIGYAPHRVPRNRL